TSPATHSRDEDIMLLQCLKEGIRLPAFYDSFLVPFHNLYLHRRKVSSLAGKIITLAAVMFRMITLRIVIKQIDMADRLDRIIHEACFDADPLFTGPRHFPGSLLDTHGKILGRLGSSGNS